MKPNSAVDHRMTSSHKRLRWMHDTLAAYSRSSRKSRSLTASRELGTGPLKPSADAVAWRSSG